MDCKNVFESISGEVKQELCENIVSSRDVRVERIISKGHTSPKSGWYDQDKNEWVMILKGSGTLVFENGEDVQLNPGDYMTIPKNTKHKVSWTDPESITIWLAVFYA